jgi:GT2 family glycosyltransferase
LQQNSDDLSRAAAPMISVIVPHYNDLVGLDRCLEALQRQTYPRDCFEIIVGDNNSPVGNGALALARFDVLAFTDSDCVPDPKWLESGIKALENLDLVGGRMDVFPEDPSKIKPVEAFELVFAFDNRDYVLRGGFSVTANLFTRQSIFKRVGYFSPLGLSEDVEWCRRATSFGFRLGYDDDVVVAHPARPTWADMWKKTLRSDTEMYNLNVGSNIARMRWLMRVLGYPISAVVHTPRVLMSRNLNSNGQRLGALSVLYRIRLRRSVLGLRLLLSSIFE